MKYKINDRVKRIEDRAIVGATVKEILSDEIYLIEYDEGGCGFWSGDYLEPL